ncbi:MAG: hypothetical protein RL571_3205 [Pseudomonadota bacterium]|jgi:SAM-dependent methyltransferase
MDSKEFGLVAVQQLFNIKNLHYGFWEKDNLVSIENFPAAQEKHTDVLFETIQKNLDGHGGDDRIFSIIDAGCGIGITTEKLLRMGHAVDGVVPSKWMAKLATENISLYSAHSTIYTCKFEELSQQKKYDIAFFSESFQYVDMDSAFDVLRNIMNKDGKIIIFDFFSKDNVEGNSPLGGGHSIGKFYKTIKEKKFTILSDVDVTENMSGNLTLINNILVDRVIPFSKTLNKFLSNKYPVFFKLFKFIFNKKINKIKYKYSSDRNAANFIKYKTYRLIELSL